jgi:hypothetical protein
VDIEDRKIGLSLKRAQWNADEETAAAAQGGGKGQGGNQGQGQNQGGASRGGMDQHGALGTDKITFGGSSKE